MTPDQQTAGKTVVNKQGDRQIHIVREFDAPRDRVFEAFTRAELIEQWWGPRGTTMKVDRLEAHTGGDWRFVIQTRTAPRRAFAARFAMSRRPSGSCGRSSGTGCPAMCRSTAPSSRTSASEPG